MIEERSVGGRLDLHADVASPRLVTSEDDLALRGLVQPQSGTIQLLDQAVVHEQLQPGRDVDRFGSRTSPDNSQTSSRGDSNGVRAVLIWKRE